MLLNVFLLSGISPIIGPSIFNSSSGEKHRLVNNFCSGSNVQEEEEDEIHP